MSVLAHSVDFASTHGSRMTRCRQPSFFASSREFGATAKEAVELCDEGGAVSASSFSTLTGPVTTSCPRAMPGRWRSRAYATALVLLLAACQRRETSDARVDRAKSIASILVPAIEHYHAATGHYPDSLSVLRVVDLNVAQTDAAPLRAAQAALERKPGANTQWTYQSLDTAYFLGFRTGLDSIPVWGTVDCVFERNRSGTCTLWQVTDNRGVHPVRVQSWGGNSLWLSLRKPAAYAVIIATVLLVVGASALLSQREDGIKSLLQFAQRLNVVSGILALVIMAPVNAPPGAIDITLLVVATSAIWFGLGGGIMLSKVAGGNSRVAFGGGALLGALVGLFAAFGFLFLLCFDCVSALWP